MGEAVAIVAIHPVIEGGKQRIVHQDVRIDRLILLGRQHHPQAQARRTAAVGHTLAQIKHLQRGDGVICGQQLIKIVPHARMRLASWGRISAMLPSARLNS